MKTAIDNNGNTVQVSDDTTVNTIDGKHYLLTPDEQATYDAQQALWIANANNHALASLRSKRDSLLTGCDWIILRENRYNTLSDARYNASTLLAWETYRQALCDLPETYASNAASVIWPTQPS